MADKPNPSSGASSKENRDVVLLCGRDTRSGEIYGLRKRGDRIHAARMRPVAKGKPLIGSEQIVRLAPRAECGALCDVEVVYEPERSQSGSRSGPPRVSSAAYRRNWDAVFGRPSGALAN